jgi:uncharacterized protein (TIGR03083 family)
MAGWFRHRIGRVTDPAPFLRALRASHDRLTGIAVSLDADDLRKRSYAKEWTIADVLSHLGSGAEIFELFVTAGLGGQAPGQEDMQRIWDTWNARSPEEQAAQSVAVNEALVSRFESLTPEQLDSLQVTMFGGMVMDAAGLLRMRLSEHAVHSWDVEVAVDPAARVSQDAVELLLGGLPQMMQWMGKQAADPAVIAVTATSPDGTYTLDTGGVTLTPGDPETLASASVALTSEALLRLVYGRVDESAVASGELRAENVTLPELQAVFPGF